MLYVSTVGLFDWSFQFSENLVKWYVAYLQPGGHFPAGITFRDASNLDSLSTKSYSINFIGVRTDDGLHPERSCGNSTG